MFWSHTRSKLKTKTGVAPLLLDVKDKKSLKFDDIEKANILQSQFKSVFIKEPGGEIPKTTIKSRLLLNDLNITDEMVKNKFLNLNTSKSLGPDEIHPRLVKELADHLARPIASFCNQTLAEGVLPRDWKKSVDFCHLQEGIKECC